MKTIRRSVKNAFLLVILSCVLICKGALASTTYQCSVEHIQESATKKVGALVCGKFDFETDNRTPKRQVFEKCQNLSVEYKTIQASGGVENFLRLSPAQDKRSKHSESHRGASLAAKAFPLEFRLESNRPLAKNKMVLDDAYILNCKQFPSKVPQ